MALHQVCRAALAAHPYGGLRAAAGSTIDLLPYQLEPAIAVLRHGRARLLIADEVGMGKTIQAGLVAGELRARSATARTLVLTPAGLRAQWSRELVTRFGLEAVDADASWLRAVSSTLPADVNPWALPGVYLASHDFVKRPEVLRPLEDLLWDLLIVDEAHAVTIGTDRRTAVDALASRARHVILLTGTPHDADAVQRAALCRIGERRADPPLIVFRRPRSILSATRPRRSVLIPVRLTDAESRMHRLLEAYTGRVWREASARGDARARLASIILRKRSLSSAASLAISLRRRMDLLVDGGNPVATQLELPIGDEDPLEDEEPLNALAAPGLAHGGRERRWLALVLESAVHASRHESKVRRLVRLFGRLREPAIVFTEYRDTLMRLRSALISRGFAPALLHGGMSAADRVLARDEFDAGARVLLATDAAAEGLNLQSRCRVVIHFELPWNPARLEQRAGRVDRIGQQRRPHEIALVASDTAERVVLVPVLRRATEARRSGAPTQLVQVLTESHIAAEIMGDYDDGHAVAAEPDGLATHDSRVELPELEREANAEVARLSIHRRWSATSNGGARWRGRPVASRGRSRSREEWAAFVYTLSLRDSADVVQHAEVAVLRATLARTPSCRYAGDVKAFADWLQRHAADYLDTGLEEAMRRCLELARPAWTAAIAVRATREQEIQAITASAARRLVQAGLFDRRMPRAALPSPSAAVAPTGPAADTTLIAESRLIAILFMAGSTSP